MKKNLIYVLLILFSVGSIAFAVEEKISHEVFPDTYQGKEIFMCADPVKSYTVASEDFEFVVWSIDKPKDFFEKPIDKGIKKGLDFDAIVVNAEGKFKLIKYVE